MYYVHNVQGIRSGVDWLTCTMAGDEGERARWANRGIVLLERCKREGEDLQERAIMGYRGVGFKNCFVGARDTDTMIQFTGQYAHRYFHRIMAPGLHISRIDVQSTVQYHYMPDGLADAALRDLTNAIANKLLNAKSKGYKLTGIDGSATAYIGAPTSSQRGKVYNKELESGMEEYARSWRYECVFRNERAQPIAYQIWDASTRWIKECYNISAAWFRSRYIHDEWNLNADLTVLPVLTLEKTSTQKQLDWLEKQVRPTVNRLREKGKIAEAYQALGLRLDDEGFKVLNVDKPRKEY